MIRGSRFTASLRSLSVLALGALAVHQLRYLAGYGSGAGTALHEQGHGYLASLAPVLLALGLAAVLATLVAGRLGAGPRGPRRRPIIGTCAYAAILIATFCSQELLEGLFAHGHPAGLEGLLGHGGWVVLPLALCFGWLALQSVRGLEAVERSLAAARLSVAGPKAPLRIGHLRPRLGVRRQSLPLAFGLARRPPPLFGN
jgi:hypothetical protein